MATGFRTEVSRGPHARRDLSRSLRVADRPGDRAPHAELGSRDRVARDARRARPPGTSRAPLVPRSEASRCARASPIEACRCRSREFDADGRVVEFEVEARTGRRLSGAGSDGEVPAGILGEVGRVLGTAASRLERRRVRSVTSGDEPCYRVRGWLDGWELGIEVTAAGRLLEVEKEPRQRPLPLRTASSDRGGSFSCCQIRTAALRALRVQSKALFAVWCHAFRSGEDPLPSLNFGSQRA